MRQPPAKPRPPAFGVSPVDQLGTRYVVRWPDNTPAAVLAIFDRHFRMLCELHGIREEGTTHFIKNLKDSSH